jgi:predicted Rossmann-fold nucleotide-binding protein
MDELFETLTLIQTHKLQKTLPVILYGSDFWNSVINFEAFLDFGTISRKDLNLFKIVDSVEEAKAYIVDCLTKAHLSD